jgi:hypothetical protein
MKDFLSITIGFIFLSIIAFFAWYEQQLEKARKRGRK